MDINIVSLLGVPSIDPLNSNRETFHFFLPGYVPHGVIQITVLSHGSCVLVAFPCASDNSLKRLDHFISWKSKLPQKEALRKKNELMTG